MSPEDLAKLDAIIAEEEGQAPSDDGITLADVAEALGLGARAVFQGVDAATAGAPTAVGRLLGEYVNPGFNPPKPIGGFAGGMISAAGAMAPTPASIPNMLSRAGSAAVRRMTPALTNSARPLLSSLEQRLARVASGAAEGGLYGAAYAGAHGGDAEQITNDALLSAGGSAGIGLLGQTAGAIPEVAGRLLGRVGKPGLAAKVAPSVLGGGPELEIRWKGDKSKIELIDESLPQILEDNGIPSMPTVLRPMRRPLAALQQHMSYMSSVQPAFMIRAAAIRDAFTAWKNRTVERLGPYASFTKNEVGSALMEDGAAQIKNLKWSGKSKYIEVLDQGPTGDWAVPGDDLATKLQDILVANEGNTGKSLNQIRSLVKRLMPAPTSSGAGVTISGNARPSSPGAMAVLRGEVTTPTAGAGVEYEANLGVSAFPMLTSVGAPKKSISLRNLWREGSRLWPDKESGLTESDIAGREAFFEVKKYILGKVDEISGTLATDPHPALVLRLADQDYAQAAEFPKTKVGKVVEASTPDNLVDNLTATQTMLKEARSWYGDDFMQMLSQQKLKDIFDRSYKPGVGIVDKAPGRAKESLDYIKLANQLRQLGGKNNNAYGEYLDELLKGNPEVREAIDVIENAAAAYHKPLRVLEGETVGEGAGILRTAMSAVTSFLAGKQMATAYLRPPPQNIFLGGQTQFNPSYQGFVNTLRKGVVGAAQPGIVGEPDQGPQVLTQGPQP